MGIKGVMAGGAAFFAAGEYGLARYFLRRTLLRQNAASERTQRMAGTDWESYKPQIRADREWLLTQPHEKVSICSRDGLKLNGTWFPLENTKRAVLCFHGYTSSGLNDYTSLARFYREQSFSLLIVDERAHGESEGTYIGFGCLDRFDAQAWAEYLAERLGPDGEIILQGISMGAATVLMATGLPLPPQVKGAVSDCAFTSAWEVFASVLKKTYHLPPFPLLNIADRMARREAKYGLDECNARREVEKARIPILFVHGTADTFVPFSMGEELYAACRSPKEFLAVEGAGHAESFYKDSKAYEAAVKRLLARALGND